MMLRILFSVATAIGLSIATPAQAGRTVIDLGTRFDTGGYCSATTFGSGQCTARQLGFALQLAGNTYDKYYINSNGVVSLGSIEFDLVSNLNKPFQSLGGYDVPVFSPNFYDGYSKNFNSDGQFVAQVVETTSNLLQIAFFECTDPGKCGRETISRGLGYAPSFYLTLQSLIGGGFSLEYEYDTEIIGTQGTYGFDLPSTGLVETTGPLQNRMFIFDADGLLTGAVPEPSSWMMMLFGFAAIGFSIRRRRGLAVAT